MSEWANEPFDFTSDYDPDIPLEDTVDGPVSNYRPGSDDDARSQITKGDSMKEWMITYQACNNYKQGRYVTHAYLIDEALAAANVVIGRETPDYEIISVVMQ